MKFTQTILGGTGALVSAAAIMLGAPTGANAQITATVYGGATWNGSDQINLSDPLFTFNTPAIQYGFSLPNGLPYGGAPYAPGGYNWFPAINLGYGPGSVFGVNFSGNIVAPFTGTFTVNLDSDDGTVLVVNGVDVQDNASPQSPNTHPVSISLTAGNNPFDLEYFECCGGTAGVDLSLGPGIAFTTPDSAEFICLTPALLCVANALRRKLKI